MLAPMKPINTTTISRTLLYCHASSQASCQARAHYGTPTNSSLRTWMDFSRASICVAIASVVTVAALNSHARADVVEPGQFGAPLQVSSTSGAPTRKNAAINNHANSAENTANLLLLTAPSQANYTFDALAAWNTAQPSASTIEVTATLSAVNVSRLDISRARPLLTPIVDDLRGNQEYFGVIKFETGTANHMP